MKPILCCLVVFLGVTCLSGATLSAQTILDPTGNLSTSWYVLDDQGVSTRYFGTDTNGNYTWSDVVGDENLFDTTQIEITRDINDGIEFSISTAFKGTEELNDDITVNLADFFIDFGTDSYGIDLTYDDVNGFTSTGLYKLTDDEDKIASWSFFIDYPGPSINDQGPHFGGTYLDANGDQNVAYVDIKTDSNTVEKIGEISELERTETTGAYIYDFTISNSILSTLGLNYLSSFDFMFGTAECANDVIIGTSPVPEPSTMILLGLGLLGFSATSRKKRLK